MFSSIPGLCMPDASSTPPAMITKNVSRHSQMSLGVAKYPPIKNHRVAFWDSVENFLEQTRENLAPDATSTTVSCLCFLMCLTGLTATG